MRDADETMTTRPAWPADRASQHRGDGESVERPAADPVSKASVPAMIAALAATLLMFLAIADSEPRTRNAEPGTSEPGTSELGTSEPGTSERGTRNSEP